MELRRRWVGRAALICSLGVTTCCLGGTGAVAQTGRVYTAADYEQAEKFMNYSVDPLVFHTMERPSWLAGDSDDRFWYRDVGPDGTTFVLVDPAKGTKAPAFDHAKVAAALTDAVKAGTLTLPGKLDAGNLPIEDFTLEDGAVLLAIGRTQVRCDLRGSDGCKPTGEAQGGGRGGGRGGRGGGGGGRAGGGAGGGRGAAEPTDISPDKKTAAFIRANNLWARDIASGKETQLTTDGVTDYGYATDNAGWTHSDRPILVWSPDSKKIATFQMDQRKVGMMYLVSTTAGHPKLDAWHYPLAGDAVLPKIERVIIDVDTAKVVRLKMPPDEHRSSLCDDISCAGGRGWEDVQWSDDGTRLAFVSTSRDHKQEWLRIADAATGDVREVMNEKVATYYESGQGKVNWSVLWKSNEVLWFSERDNWGHMYLYDLATGEKKNQITRGDGNVTEVVRVDEKARTLYFLGVGKEAGRDPYFVSLYRVNFDGSGMKLLTPDDATHAVTLSPDGRYFLDVASTVEKPQHAVVRDNNGKLMVELGRQDISKLQAAGWVAPTPITVKARDGKTDLYGFLFKPTSFDATKSYPVVDHIYPGPQTGSCGSRAFAASHSDLQSVAELGFVVVCIDGMGTPNRSKSFHDAYVADMGDNTIPDQVAGIKELAARYKWIDVNRVGIYGHSGGGYATAGAMFHYPDFFKVGIAESGNHDNRVYEDDWAEKWQGLVVQNPDGTSNYDSQANQNFAKNLKGHLLLMHGTTDDNVPPNNTLLVVDALIRANKDFDLVMIPNARHGYGTATRYATRKRWDYFVRYLAGGEPPLEYKMKQ